MKTITTYNTKAEAFAALADYVSKQETSPRHEHSGYASWVWSPNKWELQVTE